MGPTDENGHRPGPELPAPQLGSEIIAAPQAAIPRQADDVRPVREARDEALGLVAALGVGRGCARRLPHFHLLYREMAREASEVIVTRLAKAGPEPTHREECD